ncbi:hypothetical protein [Rhizobium sp. NXC24]|uniref:hypothetical protein n=1 Tax=Rhizobium sp. NXC24 TaxID=2048897 RepID=UPI000CDF4D93|nr:hypothetical protein [Rhizobium sp. NXC24]AVA21196.1 hypothetical protein NXC24_CH01540 [Rhizobium sp. NXC24]
MEIFDFELASGYAGEGSRVLARFSAQISPDVRLCGLRLVDTPKGSRTFFPSVKGGGRSATVSHKLAKLITAAAAAAFERHEIAYDRSAA